MCELFYLTVVHGVVARDTYALTMLGLQARDKAAILMFNTINTLINTLHESGVKMPEERNAFILDSQHGRRDVRQGHVQTSSERCLLFSIPYH